MTTRLEPGTVAYVVVSCSCGKNSAASSTTPVTHSSYGGSKLTDTSTALAGRLAMRPCSVSCALCVAPAASVQTSSPGGPLDDRPQRQSSSSKPASQPS